MHYLHFRCKVRKISMKIIVVFKKKKKAKSKLFTLLFFSLFFNTFISLERGLNNL